MYLMQNNSIFLLKFRTIEKEVSDYATVNGQLFLDNKHGLTGTVPYPVPYHKIENRKINHQ